MNCRVTKVNRLSYELARAMDQWMDDLGHDGKPDVWKAHIYPAAYLKHPVSFEHIGEGAPGIEDPLLDAIMAYQRGMRDYNETAPVDNDAADAYVEVSYGPPMKVLEEWEKPALTRIGAVAALRQAFEETEEFSGSVLVEPLLRAALGYLDPTDAVAL